MEKEKGNSLCATYFLCQKVDMIDHRFSVTISSLSIDFAFRKAIEPGRIDFCFTIDTMTFN